MLYQLKELYKIWSDKMKNYNELITPHNNHKEMALLSKNLKRLEGLIEEMENDSGRK
jgi:hypothetical protein